MAPGTDATAVKTDVATPMHSSPLHRPRRDSAKKSSSSSSASARRTSRQSEQATAAPLPASSVTRDGARRSSTHVRTSSGANAAHGTRGAPSSAPKGRSASGRIKTHESTDSVSSITSITSISNDPFFRTYQSPESRRLASAIAAGGDSAASVDFLPRPLTFPCLEAAPGADGKPLPSLTMIDPDEGATDEDMPELDIVIVGAPRVGKSTFIDLALALGRAPRARPPTIAVRPVSFDGARYTLRLHECGTLTPNWLAGRPPIDGALVLYDVTNHLSIAAVPETLSVLSDAAVPSMLVLCKTDIAKLSRQFDPELIARAGANLGGVSSLQTAANRAGSQERCIAALIERIVARKGGAAQLRISHRRANSDTPTERAYSSSPPRTRTSKHERASSDVSLSRQRSLGAGLSSHWSSEASGPSHANEAPARSHSRRPGNSPRSSAAAPSLLGLSAAPSAAPSPSPTTVTTSRDPPDGRVSHRSSSSTPSTSAATARTGSGTVGSSRRQSYNRSSTAPLPSSPPASRKSPSKTRRSSSSSKGSDALARSSLNESINTITTATASIAATATTFSTTTNTPASSVYVPRLSVVAHTPLRSKRSSSSATTATTADTAAVAPTTPVVQSFLIMDDDLDEAYRVSDDIPILDREDDGKAGARIRTAGQTLKELVDRLLAQPLSKSDANFGAIFLCLYRKFATPGQLLDAMLARFDELEQEDQQHMIRISAQLRHLAIMTQWVIGYPGDFARPRTRQRLSRFIASLSHNRAFAVSAKEMRSQLEVVVDDDDDCWAKSDPDPAKSVDLDLSHHPISARSTASTILSDASADEAMFGVEGGAPSPEDEGVRSTRTSGAPSSSSSGGASAHWSGGSFQTLLNAAENADREAQRLVPNPRIPLTKIQWHVFMEMLEEDIAEEMTRIDWIMFSSIRPRDLVRHVSLSSSQKEACKSLENVNRMITHFNHVAYWVSNMILLRDKPKHRAQALEKFMTIAWKLRQSNNYNSLGAVIAGINANAVHRLAQTRELVAQSIQKDFMRLEILMGTQKSHFAYRLAWENTSTCRIPFLPLHRRDLVSAEEGNRTFFDEAETRINWKKFEMMGEVIVSIQKSQGTPYLELPRSTEAQRLVLEGMIHKDDDELYDRSVRLEGPVGMPTDGSKKVFAWFR